MVPTGGPFYFPLPNQTPAYPCNPNKVGLASTSHPAAPHSRRFASGLSHDPSPTLHPPTPRTPPPHTRRTASSSAASPAAPPTCPPPPIPSRTAPPPTPTPPARAPAGSPSGPSTARPTRAWSLTGAAPSIHTYNVHATSIRPLMRQPLMRTTIDAGLSSAPSTSRPTRASSSARAAPRASASWWLQSLTGVFRASGGPLGPLEARLLCPAAASVALRLPDDRVDAKNV
jgi:hypothetical protein